MPISHSIDVTRDVILLQGEGVVTDEELMQAARQIAADPGFRPDIRMFSNYAQVSPGNFKLTAKSLAQVAALLKFSPLSRRAILVSSPLEWGVARMYGVYSEMAHGNPSQIFYLRSEALAYLNQGVPGENFLS